MEIFACPRSSWTSLGCTPSQSSSVAQVCPRSCKRTEWGRPTRSRSGLNERAVRFLAHMVVPRMAAASDLLSCSAARHRSCGRDEGAAQHLVSKTTFGALSDPKCSFGPAEGLKLRHV